MQVYTDIEIKRNKERICSDHLVHYRNRHKEVFFPQTVPEKLENSIQKHHIGKTNPDAGPQSVASWDTIRNPDESAHRIGDSANEDEYGQESHRLCCPRFNALASHFRRSLEMMSAVSLTCVLYVAPSNHIDRSCRFFPDWLFRSRTILAPKRGFAHYEKEIYPPPKYTLYPPPPSPLPPPPPPPTHTHTHTPFPPCRHRLTQERDSLNTRPRRARQTLLAQFQMAVSWWKPRLLNSL